MSRDAWCELSVLVDLVLGLRRMWPDRESKFRFKLCPGLDPVPFGQLRRFVWAAVFPFVRRDCLGQLGGLSFVPEVRYEPREQGKRLRPFSPDLGKC